MSGMSFQRGDHVCAIYSTSKELSQHVATFLAEGLRNHERCWYVAAGDELEPVQTALQELNVDVTAEINRKALQLISGDGAYVVRGRFEPEATIRIFNDAIEQAYTDGFTGFRAAADMSWALNCVDGAQQVIVYEALLKPLFSTCRAVGLCLYDRERMPLGVINGALATHPVVGAHGHYHPSPFYDATVTQLAPVEPSDVIGKLAQLDRRHTAPHERS